MNDVPRLIEFALPHQQTSLDSPIRQVFVAAELVPHVVDRPLDAKTAARERRKIYDTTHPSRGNGGHSFGDMLTEQQRTAVMEYLKTL